MPRRFSDAWIPAADGLRLHLRSSAADGALTMQSASARAGKLAGVVLMDIEPFPPKQQADHLNDVGGREAGMSLTRMPDPAQRRSPRRRLWSGKNRHATRASAAAYFADQSIGSLGGHPVATRCLPDGAQLWACETGAGSATRARAWRAGRGTAAPRAAIFPASR